MQVRDGEGWRVASAMVGSVGWDEPGLQNVDADIRLGRTLIERRPRIQDGDDGEDGGPGSAQLLGWADNLVELKTSSCGSVGV